MEVSEGHTHGYDCDMCNGSSLQGYRGGSRERWHCKQCDEDFCFNCIPKQTGKYPV